MKTSTCKIRCVLAIWGLAAVAAACGTPLRAPLCKEGEFEFPAGAEGRYRISVVGSDPRWSDAYASLSEFEFIIRPEPNAYEVRIGDRVATNLVKAFAGTRRSARPLLAALGDTGGSDDGAGPDEPPMGDPVMPIAVCRIGDAYYSQERQDEGTWLLSRLDVSPTGLTTVTLAFEPEELAKAGFGYALLPGFSDVDKRGKWDFDTTRLVVDTRGLDEAARAKLLSLAHPTAGGIVYSRIGPAGPAEKHGRKERVLRLPRAR